MLMSLLEAAPISTIDAFLSEILAPHIDSVALHLSKEQLPDEKAPLLRTQALNSAWRIRNARDAIEAGMLQSADDLSLHETVWQSDLVDNRALKPCWKGSRIVAFRRGIKTPFAIPFHSSKYALGWKYASRLPPH